MKEVILNCLTEIRPEFNFEESNNFISEGMLDSFDIVALVTSLDDAYGISIQGTDIVPENFTDINTIEELLVKNGAKR